MQDKNWRNQRIAIIGYGVEGQSSVNYFLRHGAQVDVHDHKPIHSLPADQVNGHRSQDVNFITESAAFTSLAGYDLVMRTPTFSPYHPALKEVASNKISSQTTLFLQNWRDQTIGISGTKGKGTVATLIHHLLQKSGQSTLLGGNIGVPLLDIIDEMNSSTTAVVELSSFQLWDITVSPHIAVLLMVTPEHLEQHQNLDDYLQAKQRLLQYQLPQDEAVILSDYAYTKQIAQNMPGYQWLVSSQKTVNGAYVENDEVFIASRPNKAVVRLSDTVLRGSHNTQNLAAAVVAAELSGVDVTNTPALLHGYRPLPHRLELVAQYKQLSFYDDSIATTPEAAMAGIHSFTEPLVVILGGINKQAEWNEVAQILREPMIRGVALVGEEAPRIKDAIAALNLEIPMLFQPESYEAIIPWSEQLLTNEKRGVVLLSPGAKSFDQYQDYRDRGQKFATAVQKFIAEASV